MKKILLLLYIALNSTVVHAQKSFHIKGSFKNFNGVIYLMRGDVAIDSTMVKDGSFEFSGKSDHAMPASFRINTSLRCAMLGFIVEPADLMMKVDTVYRRGNPPILFVNSIITSGGTISGLVDNFNKTLTAKLKDVKSEAAYKTAYINEVKDFSNSNPNQEATLCIITNHINYFDVEDLKQAYDHLDGSIRTGYYAKEIKKKIDRFDRVGTIVNDFMQPDVNGKSVSIKNFRGKYVLIDLWSSTCGPCRRESPKLKEFYSKYKSQGFEILGVSLDVNKDSWLKAIAKDKLPWVQVSDLQGFNNKVFKILGFKGMPDNILIDTKGEIIAQGLHGDALDQKLKEIFKM